MQQFLLKARLAFHWSKIKSQFAESLYYSLHPPTLLHSTSSPGRGHKCFFSKRFKMYALSKLNKQNEQTWVNLQKRLNEVQFQYRSLFTTAEVHNFVKNKSLAVGSCEGYFIPSLLTTTAYVLAANQATVQTLTHSQPLNIFTIFVGYPGTGKIFRNTLEALFSIR